MLSCWLLGRRLCWGARAGDIAAGFGLRSFCWIGCLVGSGGSGSLTSDGVAAGAVSASSVRLGPSVLNGCVASWNRCRRPGGELPWYVVRVLCLCRRVLFVMTVVSCALVFGSSFAC